MKDIDELGDRELLELSAKAAGIEGEYIEIYLAKIGAIERVGIHSTATNTMWNPLTDDGDALRLAVRLYMSLDVSNKRVCALRAQLPGSIETGDDMMAMMRRAITREAAAR